MPTEQEPDAFEVAAYQVLMSRFVTSTQQLWQMIAFVLSAEGALWVALLTAGRTSALFAILIALGLTMFGTLGPLSVRFVESGIMLDRQLLDVYEYRHLPAELLQAHGMRLERRFAALAATMDDDARRALFKRRFAAAASPLSSWRWKVDKTLSLLGQPSLVWTAAICMAGASGAGAALYVAGAWTWLAWVAGCAIAAVVAALWVLGSLGK